MFTKQLFLPPVTAENKIRPGADRKQSYCFVWPNKIGPLKNESGELVGDPLEMSEILSKQYVKMFSEPHNLSNPINNTHQQVSAHLDV